MSSKISNKFVSADENEKCIQIVNLEKKYAKELAILLKDSEIPKSKGTNGNVAAEKAESIKVLTKKRAEAIAALLKYKPWVLEQIASAYDNKNCDDLIRVQSTDLLQTDYEVMTEFARATSLIADEVPQGDIKLGERGFTSMLAQILLAQDILLYPDLVQFTCQGMADICNLNDEFAAFDDFKGCRGLSNVVKSDLVRDVNRPELAKAVCHALWTHASGLPDNITQLGEMGAVEGLVELLRAHYKTDPSVCHYASKATDFIAYFNPENKARFRKAGVVALLTDIMYMPSCRGGADGPAQRAIFVVTND